MAYDYVKVQAWLQRVPKDVYMLLWLACLDRPPRVSVYEGSPYRDLVNEFRSSPTWERTNMLYGLKDLVDAEMAYDIHCYAQTARREDEAHDPELQRILRARSSMGCLVAAVTNCRICGQPFDHTPCPHGSIDPATGCNSPVEKVNGQGH
jgi:hypothetical protein